MGQPVAAILSRQDELSATARQFTGDVNEAGLLVSKVVSRAFSTFPDGGSEEAVAREMRRDLDRLINQLRKPHH